MRAIVCAIVVTIGLTVHPTFARADRAAASFWKSVQSACNATAAKPSELGRRIAQTAIEEFTRFGGHRIDADGRLFRFGLTEAEHEDDDGGGRPARVDRLGWWQVMKYWHALFGSDTAAKLEVRGYRDASTSTEETQVAALLRTNAAQLLRLAEEVSDPAEREMLREAALRAAIIDTSWSAAFVSYVIQKSGVTADAFRFANAHSVYIYDAFATTLSEPANEAGDRLYRACPITTTRPRVGDLICNQREPAFAGASDNVVRERIRADLSGGSIAGGPAAAGFVTTAAAGSLTTAAAGSPATGTPTRSIRRTHCEVVVHVDARAHKLYTIGGNVNQAVAARKLNLRRDLTFSAAQKGRCGGAGHWTMPQPADHTPPAASPAPKCSLNDKKWFVLLQLR
jgi:hypothetical protein